MLGVGMGFWPGLLFVVAVLGLSAAITGRVRKYALNGAMMDVPNERSSHVSPTPRGGGVAIVAVFTAAVLFLHSRGFWDSGDLVGWLCGGAIVATLGFIDDRGHISARWRLVGHFAAAIIAVYAYGGGPLFVVGDYSGDLGWVGSLVGVLGTVWLLNLYNFMDGIDGIAAVEAVTCGFGAAILLRIGFEGPFWWAPAIVALTSMGFLVWNWPPAKIFMGDVGSGFLGFIFAGLAISHSDSNLSLWTWMILLGVFIVDATYTLFRRAWRGEKVFEAHRDHGYQIASRKLKSHSRVTVGVALVNMFWLFPLACLAEKYEQYGLLVLILAFLPLLALRYKLDLASIEERTMSSV